MKSTLREQGDYQGRPYRLSIGGVRNVGATLVVALQ